ncbi:large conductance mechanosensitive channel protein MscL [Actinocatenispora rupis]|uniref:Large-conductance mechanosensitive channel n=1 Tax=Actinocatenispora rupis TaxID=519421 RepID=A0A8J3IX43_9ACTN|nr:large conductance mechanosensitive channel protein MscL [Actinocatenispora rupis]GID10290.1 large-conductance mechanosensitive channel [Actinocatenispora rupis]
MLKGFRDFILRGNVVDLAVGIVIGAAFTAVVNALVSSFITPLIAAIGGKQDFSSLYFTLNGSQFKYGVFINAVFAFLIVAAVLYFLVVVPVDRMLRRFFPAKLDAPKRDCPECLSSIPAAASRCSFCTAQVDPTA